MLVLILVLVEDGLRELDFKIDELVEVLVLILVLVEDGLRVMDYIILRKLANGLNPCSCGGWSQRP